jgi:predicted phosphodiesterase
LVFGHTHRPFVNTSENVINTGSWVTDAPVHNTYVRIDAGRPRLYVYGGSEITQREEC